MRIHLLLYSISRGLPRPGTSEPASGTGGDFMDQRTNGRVVGWLCCTPATDPIHGIHRPLNSWLSLVVIAITDLTVIRATPPRLPWVGVRCKRRVPPNGSILDKWPCGFGSPPFTLYHPANQWIYSIHLYFNTQAIAIQGRTTRNCAPLLFNQAKEIEILLRSC